MSLTTLRIKRPFDLWCSACTKSSPTCDPTTHIPKKLKSSVLEVIYLEKEYFELSVEQDTADEVAECFYLNHTRYRLQPMADPLFSAERGSSPQETTRRALNLMKVRYNEARYNLSKSKCPEKRLLEWFEREIETIDELHKTCDVFDPTCQ